MIFKKSCFIILILFVVQFQIFAHSGKPKYHVVIDTDGAIDDMRSISMLLAGNDIRVLAITSSQGTTHPLSGFNKVNSLLAAFYHQGIPVGIGSETNFPLPPWASFAEKTDWGNAYQNPPYKEDAINLLNRTIKDYPSKLTLIALGSLKTYTDWLKSNPDIIQNIERIIWYNTARKEDGFNYMADTNAYNYIVKSNIQLIIVSNSREDLICNAEYLTFLKNTKSVYAQQICKVFNQPAVFEKVIQNHLQLWDDLLPLYLSVPILFTSNKKDNITYVSVEKSVPASFVYETISKLLLSGISANNRVFIAFPIDTLLYKKEYAEMLNSTIEKYGQIEWKSITMTNEIHGHTGIYSIIGAKMGIRAIEYFNVGVNNLKAETFVGYGPPLSCLNDGVQISTGATIGQGLITVSDTVIKIPTVIFEFNKQKIRMSLNKEIAKQMENDIKQGASSFGMSDKYWLYIEELAIKYWAGYDRHEIFTIEKI